MTDFTKDITIIIPSYKPDGKLIEVVNGVLAKGFTDIVIVNDGSGSDYDSIFAKATTPKECTLLVHEVNRGKGCAMKTAYEYCIKHRPNCKGVITVDGDNQHHPDDIATCAKLVLEHNDHVILGARDFSGPDVPPRSYMGNTITRMVFRIVCGIKLKDTQTGLRAFPYSMLPLMASIEGERYEYETNVLLEMKANNIPFMETTIRTIYIEENNSSHFNAFRDSFRIYKIIFKFVASSTMSAIIDLALFYVLTLLLNFIAPGWAWSILTATAIARVCSSLFNYHVNRRKVFKSGDNHSVVRYYILCVCQLLASAGLVTLLTSLIPSGSFLTTLLKLCVDTILFFISYQIQRDWVFKNKKAIAE